MKSMGASYFTTDQLSSRLAPARSRRSTRRAGQRLGSKALSQHSPRRSPQLEEQGSVSARKHYLSTRLAALLACGSPAASRLESTISALASPLSSPAARRQRLGSKALSQHSPRRSPRLRLVGSVSARKHYLSTRLAADPFSSRLRASLFGSNCHACGIDSALGSKGNQWALPFWPRARRKRSTMPSWHPVLQRVSPPASRRSRSGMTALAIVRWPPAEPRSPKAARVTSPALLT